MRWRPATVRRAACGAGEFVAPLRFPRANGGRTCAWNPGLRVGIAVRPADAHRGGPSGNQIAKRRETRGPSAAVGTSGGRSASIPPSRRPTHHHGPVDLRSPASRATLRSPPDRSEARPCGHDALLSQIRPSRSLRGAPRERRRAWGMRAGEVPCPPPAPLPGGHGVVREPRSRPYPTHPGAGLNPRQPFRPRHRHRRARAATRRPSPRTSALPSSCPPPGPAWPW